MTPSNEVADKDMVLVAVMSMVAAPVVEIPEAQHHVMLDQPLALVASLRALLADWDHSVATRRPG